MRLLILLSCALALVVAFPATDVFDETEHDLPDELSVTDDSNVVGDDDDDLKGILWQFLSLAERYHLMKEKYDFSSDYLDPMEERSAQAGQATLANTENTTVGVTKRHRQKRWIIPVLRTAPIFFRAARHLFKDAKFDKFIRHGKHYFKPGNYRDALKDFHRFKPKNVKSLRPNAGNVQGKTGTVGNTRYTVRNKSGKDGKGPPTLEMRAPKSKANKNTHLRKLRYWNERYAQHMADILDSL